MEPEPVSWDEHRQYQLMGAPISWKIPLAHRPGNWACRRPSAEAAEDQEELGEAGEGAEDAAHEHQLPLVFLEAGP